MKVGDIDADRWSSLERAVSQRPTVAAVGRTPRALQAAADPKLIALHNLSSEGQKPTAIEMEAAIDDFDVVDANYILRCRLVMDCIARLQIDTENGRQQATGFLIAPGLLMTNHHVLPTLETAIGGLAQFGYWHDVAGGDHPTATFAMEPERFFVNDRELDFAVVAMSPTATNGVLLSERGYLKLSPSTGKTHKGKFVTIIQHPDGDYMQIALRENKVETASQDEYVIRYKADTAHGSSGAPVFNDSFQIAALHSGGRIKRDPTGNLYLLKTGEYVASVDDRSESEVVWEINVGIRISRICALLPDLAAGKPGSWEQVIESAMAGGDVLSTAVAGKGTIATPISMGKESKVVEGSKDKKRAFGSPVSDGEGGLILPLGLKVSLIGLELESPVPEKISVPPETLVDSTEAFRFQIPVIYDNLPGRKGFDRTFLGLAGGELVPMPKLTAQGESVAAPLLGGEGNELRYHKFSAWMHAERRLALFTAANIDWRERPEEIDGQKVNRKTLNGFDPNKDIREQWVTDSRIAPKHQLPDVFFNKDYYKPGSQAGAFDKGHIVRRDDVCWGDSFDDIQMANGDTFHVTNCSPQIGEFNQPLKGKDNWGDLEELVEKQTGPKEDNEKIVIFAGPIFGAKDRWFNGQDDDGMIRVQIPRAYWKIVVNRQAGGGVGAYGFVLEQDIVPFTEDEFRITPNWKGKLKRISEIQDKMRGWVDLSDLIAVDKFANAIAHPV